MTAVRIIYKWIKKLPITKINRYQDRVVYNVAVFTREYTKGTNAYPYLTGNLARAEMAQPIRGYNKTYSLLSGTGYDKYVWRMKDVNWTNKSTKPQWYYKQIHTAKKKILTNAVNAAKKEI